MNNMYAYITYIGEHLFPGQLGHFLVILGFVASLTAVVAFSLATRYRDEDPLVYKNIGRAAFGIHGIAVFGIIGTLFFLMINKYYEYQYVFAHVSEDLPFKYIFSAFWEGQEGSFLLWMFWHVVLGMILMFKGKTWEAPVMATLALIEVFLASMLLGIYITDEFKLGSNPFLLLRDTMEGPIFQQEDYVGRLKDLANGLNPLLQNYWMTIHPPTLFLGFASTSIPFCFAIAGLWTKRHKAWLKPALPWALFSGTILGTGILMGGAWAYEALSFGGYWAWDPVENMSLVPWLILIAGIHTNLVANATGQSIKSTYVFYILTFVLIVYSTYLTRSGVLEETSVHAFTEMGLEGQLIAFISFFTLLGFAFLFARLKGIPVPAKEEATPSREFWMFIGSLVLLFSAILITASTSLPVYNKIRELFQPGYEGGVILEPIAHYNKYQLWIAVFIALLAGTSQLLRYKERNFMSYAPKLFNHIVAALAIAGLLTYVTSLWINLVSWQYSVMLFAGLFAVISNLDYLLFFIKGNFKLAGAVFSHVGFGLMLVGILASGLNKEHISTNPFVQQGLIEGATDDDLKKNVFLIRDEPLLMSGYEVTYTGDTIDGFTRQFFVNFKKRNQEGEVEEEFNLSPNVLYDKSMTKIAASNPSTKRYLHKDIFTHIASLPKAEVDPAFAKATEDSLDYEKYELAIGDTAFTKQYYAILKEVITNPEHPDYEPKPKDLPIGLKLAVKKLKSDSVWYANPVLVLRNSLVYSFPDKINDLAVKVKLPQDIFEAYYTSDSLLNYQTFTLKEGDVRKFAGLNITFKGFNREPEHPNYSPVKGDIAVGAILEIKNEETGATMQEEPIYLIRGSRNFNLKAVNASSGLHLRFIEINPKTEMITIAAARDEVDNKKLPVEIAEGALRSDYIVLEAIEFPGINFFWLGSVLMMVGLGMAMFRKMAINKKMSN